MRTTVTKTYSNLKAAHRQWRHSGHCHFVHGENWTFHIEFTAEELDECNFIVDFGGLRPLRSALESLFDHTLLIDADDPSKSVFQNLHDNGLVDVRFVPSASAEGLAKLVFEIAQNIVSSLTSGRVRVVSVVCEEDTKNIAKYSL